jgi:NAD(P)-dependent dehydrogenase (short-subunit alcohol dehydrogenase family)
MATFLVVGGSSGIGLEVTNQLAAAGHTVHATYNTHVMESVGNIHYHNVNVLDESINLDFLPASIEGIVYCPGAISLRPFNRIASEDF